MWRLRKRSAVWRDATDLPWCEEYFFEEKQNTYHGFPGKESLLWSRSFFLFLTPRNKQTLCVLEKISAVEFPREKKNIVVAQKQRAALKELQRFKKLLTFCGAAEGKGIKKSNLIKFMRYPTYFIASSWSEIFEIFKRASRSSWRTWRCSVSALWWRLSCRQRSCRAPPGPVWSPKIKMFRIVFGFPQNRFDSDKKGGDKSGAEGKVQYIMRKIVIPGSRHKT